MEFLVNSDEITRNVCKNKIKKFIKIIRKLKKKRRVRVDFEEIVRNYQENFKKT